MSEFIEENKKMIILAIVLIVITILFGIINMFMDGSSKKTTPEKALKELGQIYYEELLYPYLTTEYNTVYEDVLDGYKELGIKVTLEKLLDSITNSKEEIFENENVSCDKTRTYIIIYPTGYEKKDYRIETDIIC